MYWSSTHWAVLLILHTLSAGHYVSTWLQQHVSLCCPAYAAQAVARTVLRVALPFSHHLTLTLCLISAVFYDHLLHLIHGGVSYLENHPLLQSIELAILTLIRQSLPRSIGRGDVLE